MKNDLNKIHCVGDSHAQFFLGKDKMLPDGAPMRGFIPFFKVHHLGASLAYNLCKTDSASQGRERLFNTLSTLPQGAKVLLSFGEIDCRCHVIRQAKEQNRSVDLVVQEIAARYLSVIREVVGLGFRVMVWGPPPSARDDAPINSEFPCFGTCQERNHALSRLEHHIKKGIEGSLVCYASVLDKLVDQNLTTKTRCHFDGVHLSQRSMPPVILQLRALRAISFRDLCFYFLALLPFVIGPYNLAFYFWRQCLRPLLRREDRIANSHAKLQKPAAKNVLKNTRNSL